MAVCMAVCATLPQLLGRVAPSGGGMGGASALHKKAVSESGGSTRSSSR